MLRREFFQDEKVAKLPFWGRLLFQGMWTEADDEGYCRANPVWLRSQILPFDDIPASEIDECVKTMAEFCLVFLYEVKGEKYLRVNNFSRHQTIDKPSKWRNPKPEQSDTSPPTTTLLLDDQSALNKNGMNKNGMNKNGMNKNGIGVLSPARLVEIYHQHCPEMPKVVKLSSARIAVCKARISEYPDESFWIEQFSRAAKSDFLHGRVEGSRPGWRADFDFLINPNKLVNLQEGKYDNRNRQPKTVAEKYGKSGTIKI